MLHDLLTFLPFAACLFWMIVHCVTSFRTGTFSDVLLVMIMASVFFLIDGYYSSLNNKPAVYVWMSLFFQIVATSLIPVLVLYLDKLQAHHRNRKSSYLWIVVPAGMFAATGLLMSIIGTDALADFIAKVKFSGADAVYDYKGKLEYTYFLWSNILLRFMVALEMIFFLWFVISSSLHGKYSFSKFYNFFFKGKKADVLQLELSSVVFVWVAYAIRIFLFKPFIDSHPVFTAILSVMNAICILAFGYFALFSSQKEITLRQASNVMRYNYNASNKQEIVEEMIGELLDDAEAEALRHIRERIGSSPEIEAWQKGEKDEPSVASSIFNAVAGSWDEDSLMGQFQRLMLEEQLYLQPGLNLSDVADRLESNKTYISKMVNNTYNIGFPELLNILRIDFAEHYIMVHRDAKQEQIARDCGFLSASSFNTTFKKVTGMTPRVWIASQEKKNK